jgi:hypothetical protein
VGANSASTTIGKIGEVDLATAPANAASMAVCSVETKGRPSADSVSDPNSAPPSLGRLHPPSFIIYAGCSGTLIERIQPGGERPA